MIFVGLFVIGSLGLFAFEMSRYALAHNQLRNCVDAAALSGAATLVMSNDPAQTLIAQKSAIKVAMKLFKQNSILGESLTAASQAARLPLKPGPHQSALFFEFLIPATATTPAQPAPMGNPDAKIIRVTGSYGVVPVFGGFLPIGSVPVWSSSISSIPMIDVVDCFDVGGSMDDQTNVTFIKRVWVPTLPGPGYVDYQPVLAPSGAVAEGTIAKILNEPPRGVNLNGLEPQGLENANTAPMPLKFSELAPAATVGLRGLTDAGSPPGNYPPPFGVSPTPSVGGQDVFTDVVVNLDGNAHFGGCSVGGWNFPNVAVLVEAARGNLESPAVFAAAGLLGNNKFAGIVPRPGYKVFGYECYAQQSLTPLNTARNAALNFSFDLLHTNTCQLGEVSFNDQVGFPGPLSTFTAPNVSAAYSQARSGTFLLPNQWEEPINDQLFAIYKALCSEYTSPAARNWGATNNAGLAISAAVGWLTNPKFHRPNADRAIVLFTNSAPSVSEMPNTRAAAKRAHDLGIPVYVVGLAQNAGIRAIQLDAFTDANSDPSSGGVCGISGHGARFFQVTTPDDIPNAFGNVNRHLIKLTTSN
jgi:hypothetical protein